MTVAVLREARWIEYSYGASEQGPGLDEIDGFPGA
jgi:hypothetical protein